MIVELVGLGLWLGGCIITGLWIRSLKGIRARNRKTYQELMSKYPDSGESGEAYNSEVQV